MWFFRYENNHSFGLVFLTIVQGLVGANFVSAELTMPAPTDSEVSSLAARRELLLQAIRERRVLTFIYRGHSRTVELHACGVSSKGEPVLNGYQTGGGSASRPPPGWRAFSIAEIRDLALGLETFPGARDGYFPNELRLDPLWAELPAADPTD
ncbi:hypothetical protein EBZ70_07445 [bacterium]|nr:hypothetical protein [bacterium]